MGERIRVELTDLLAVLVFCYYLLLVFLRCIFASLLVFKLTMGITSCQL
jgi:hypothetical protein